MKYSKCEDINEALEEIRLAKSYIDNAAEEQLKVWRGEKVENQPLLLHCSAEDIEFPKHSYKEIHYDKVKNMEYYVPYMLAAVRGGAGAVPSARANMGCGIYAALFGLVQELYDDKMPWLVNHLTKKEIKNISIKDIKITDEFKVGLEHMEYLAEVLGGVGAKVFPMDLQGPFDLAHLVYGDDIFYDLYDDREFVSHLMGLCVHAINIGSSACLDIIPESDKIVAHYCEMVMPTSLGGIKTSEDTATLLAKEHISKITMKASEQVLDFAGGGYIHYCGKNNHLLNEVFACKYAAGLNFGNPEMHDMEEMLKKCAQKRKVYYGHIVKKEKENFKDYFSRLLKASYNDGKFYLLLSLKCELKERNMIVDAWQASQEEARRIVSD